MDVPTRYAVTLPGPVGAHRSPEVVVVQATGALTSSGTAVYANVAGTFRVEISNGVARPLDVPSGPGLHTCLHAAELPPERGQQEDRGEARR